MSEKIIEVSGLQKSYKENHVLKDVSFTIDKGSIFALLGSNGAGKTTVIKILSTLLKADGGSAVVNGFNVATNGGNVRECISLTGQFVAVDEVLTVIPARHLNTQDAKELASHCMEDIDKDFAAQLIRRLYQPPQLRVAFLLEKQR